MSDNTNITLNPVSLNGVEGRNLGIWNNMNVAGEVMAQSGSPRAAELGLVRGPQSLDHRVYGKDAGPKVVSVKSF